MNLPVALALWLANACIAGLFGYWLGRVGVGSRKSNPRPVNGDQCEDPALVVDDLNAAAVVVDAELDLAIAAFKAAAEPASHDWCQRIGGRFKGLLTVSRGFERQLKMGHERICERKDGVWPALAVEVLRHRDRVVELCDSLDRQIESSVLPTAATVSSILSQAQDFSDQNRQLREELAEVKAKLADREASLFEAERQARLDSLTRLPNRRSFDERLAAAQTRAEAGIESYAVILFDLDRFKILNDTHGHPFGDAVLSVFGRILTDTIRASDHAARFGGEEFAVLLPGADSLAANAVAERCRRQAERSIVRRAATQGSFTVSGGVASWDEGRSSEQVLAAADQALYAAKADGRNRIHLQAAFTEEELDGVTASSTALRSGAPHVVKC